MAKRSVNLLRLTVLLLVAALLLSYLFIPPFRNMVRPMIGGKKTVSQVMDELRPQMQPKVLQYFKTANVSFPPKRMTLLAIKDQKYLEVWASSPEGWRQIVDYQFTAYSGTLGPKLAEGDGQIPEGIYQIESLNPNSQFHLSMRINYPNDFDLSMAHRDNRSHLGDDIFIHGKSASIGCIAIGDKPIEELFYMVASAGANNVEVIITPTDLRVRKPAPRIQDPSWTPELYAVLRNKISELVP